MDAHRKALEQGVINMRKYESIIAAGNTERTIQIVKKLNATMACRIICIICAMENQKAAFERMLEKLESYE